MKTTAAIDEFMQQQIDASKTHVFLTHVFLTLVSREETPKTELKMKHAKKITLKN